MNKDVKRWGDNYDHDAPKEIKPPVILGTNNPLKDGIKKKEKQPFGIGGLAFVVSGIFGLLAIFGSTFWGNFVLKGVGVERFLATPSPWIILGAAAFLELSIILLGIYAVFARKGKQNGIAALLVAILIPFACWVAFFIMSSQ